MRPSPGLLPDPALVPDDGLPARPAVCRCCASHNPRPLVVGVRIVGGIATPVCPTAAAALDSLSGFYSALGRVATNAELRDAYGFLPSLWLRRTAGTAYAARSALA